MVIARLLPATVVAAFVILNGWSGLMPGVGYWDTGEFQAVLPIMGTAHPTGYPTYVLLGFVANLLLAPIGEPAFRINALSLIAVAVAAAFTTLLVRRLTGSTIIGVATGIGLALTPLVWVNATRADPHPIHLAFVSILLYALVRWEDSRRALESRPAAAEADGSGESVGSGKSVAAATAVPDASAAVTAAAPTAAPEPGDSRPADRWLVVAAVVFGLAAGNHSLTLLLAPPIALYVLAVEPGILHRWRFALTCFGAALAAMVLVFLELPIRGGLLRAPLVYAEPATWDGFWYIALAEQFRGSLGDPFSDLGTKVDNWVKLATLQAGPLVLALVPAVVVAALRAPRYLVLSGSAFLITIFFNAAYSNADIDRYYLGPILIAWTWLGILAAELARSTGFLAPGLVSRARRIGDDARVLERTTSIAAVVLAVVLLVPTAMDFGARRGAADRSGETSAAAWLDEVLPIIEPDAVLVSWWSTSTPLWYAQHVEGRRRDIFVVDDRTMLDLHLGRAPDVIARYLAEGRPVYAIRIDSNGDLEELTSQFDMTLVASGGTTGVWKVRGYGFTLL